MTKIGILGGGQLGRMLLQAAANYHCQTYILENDGEAPAAHLCHKFVLGDITNFDAVYAFGKMVDVLTIEIENVNIEALEKLEAEGLNIIPKPAVLKTIKNKIAQKQYYSAHEIPTAKFVVTQNQSEIQSHESILPAVHKIAEGGYDGKGVQIIDTLQDISKGFDAPSVLEKKIIIAKEIAQSIAIAQNGEVSLYPPVEMIFDPVLNLLDYQLCPAHVSEKVLWKIEAISLAVAKNFKSPGLFAVELLIDKDDNVWVNETAPRVHNSGHHTIEAHFCSQFDMLIRIMLGLPLGNTEAILPSAMINIIGEAGYSGNAYYAGLDEVLKIESCFVHLYGKAQTKPGRKMGHVTIMSKDKLEITYQANKIKHTLKVITQ